IRMQLPVSNPPLSRGSARGGGEAPAALPTEGGRAEPPCQLKLHHREREAPEALALAALLAAALLDHHHDREDLGVGGVEAGARLVDGVEHLVGEAARALLELA